LFITGSKMELRQLRYFVAIARHGSFSVASLHIGVAQPALSTQIANLEKEVGQPLFDRHARGARMTDAGETFLDHAVAILQRVDAALLALRPTLPRGATEITLGMPPLISMMLTVPLVEAVGRDLANVSLKIIEGMSGALRGWLADGSLDLAFLHNVDREEFPNALPIIRENLFAAASASAGFSLGATLHGRDLVKLPLIASTAKNSHRRLLESIGRRYGSPLHIVAEVDSIPRQRELVCRGIGVLVMPMTGLSDWLKDEIQFAELIGEDIGWESSLVAAESPAGSAAMEALAPLIVSLTHDLVRSGRWPGET
jgi:LysR family nitrogen assimilation transcriptional regulator